LKYHGKLMSYYGLDVKTGKWNTKFPVTQTDAQIKGINSDISSPVNDLNNKGFFDSLA